MSEAEKQIRVDEHIKRIRSAVVRMRGLYRRGIAPATGLAASAFKSIRGLWGVAGLPDPAPRLHGAPRHEAFGRFRSGCALAIELLDEVEANSEHRDDEAAGYALTELAKCINGLWRCCEGLKVKQAQDASDEDRRKLNAAKQAQRAAERTALDRADRAASVGAA